jgi:biotin transport system substrate-specific component
VRIQDLVYISLFAAITAALGLVPPIPVPLLPVPITAQALGPLLAGSILGARRGGLSQGLFLLLVGMGAPLLSGGRGGLGVFAGPSAGYLFGFALAAFTVGWATERAWRRLGLFQALAINLLAGVSVIHACGIPVLAALSGLGLANAAWGSLAFLPGDGLKAVIAALIAVFVKRGYPLIDSRSAASPGAP